MVVVVMSRQSKCQLLLIDLGSLVRFFINCRARSWLVTDDDGANEPPGGALIKALLLDDGLSRHVTAKLGLDLDGGVIERRVAQVNVQQLFVLVGRVLVLLLAQLLVDLFAQVSVLLALFGLLARHVAAERGLDLGGRHCQVQILCQLGGIHRVQIHDG